MTEQIEPGSASHAAQQRQRASQLAQAVRGELQKALIGQNQVIDDVLDGGAGADMLVGSTVDCSPPNTRAGPA